MFGGFYTINYSYFFYMIPAIVIAMWAQFNVKSTFGKYSKMLSNRGITGAQVARQILDRNGLNNVSVQQINGKLNDYYDPQKNEIRLSTDVFNSSSVAAIGVAAHETGHAIQHSVGYSPLKLRNAIIPISKFGSNTAMIVIIGGLIFSWQPLLLAGIILFSTVLLFQLVTLPVEFNASARALTTLDESGILFGDELKGARKVLTAAALTYVAAMLASIMTLLYYLSLLSGMRKRN
jgi:Zn-dependent membrane protease YugP